MSDIQKINAGKPIDNGGITTRYPFGEGEGRDAKISSQDIKTQASNLLNKFKPLRRFEAKTFSTLFSLMEDGTLGIYQSDLPYPGLSNYTLKSQIDISLNTNGDFYLYNHNIITYNNNIYVIYGINNIKVLDSSFNISEINIGNRSDTVFKKDSTNLFSFVDNTLYEIDLETNTSSVYGTSTISTHPVVQGIYHAGTSQFAVFSENTDGTGIVNILNSSLVNQHTYESSTAILNIYIIADQLYIYSLGSQIVIDLNTYNETTTSENYSEISSINIFDTYQTHYSSDTDDTIQSIYRGDILLGRISLDFRVLLIDETTDLAVLVNNTTGDRFACSLSLLLKNNLQTLINLE